jgi:hypothetical protein
MSLTLLSVNPGALAKDSGQVSARFQTGGPLTRVLRAIIGGGRTNEQLATMTGMDTDMVASVIDHLLRTGRLTQKQLAYGCPSGGCGSCALAGGCSQNAG